MVDKADVEQVLRRGDLVQVSWVDILEDPVGDVKQAKVGQRTSFAIFWEIKEMEGLTILVTTTTVDETDTGQMGYCAYPLGVVKDIKLIRRGKKANVRNTTTKAHRAS